MRNLPSLCVATLACASSILTAASDGRAETRQARKARILAPTTDFTKAEPFELFQGGSGTNRSHFDRSAFARPSSNLTFEQRYDFSLGDAVFDRPWVVAPSSTIASDGLGPLYNARACIACHIQDGRGHPPEPGDTNMVSMLFALSNEQGQADPIYGNQFQDQAIAGMKAEGTVRVSYKTVPFTYPDGTIVDLRKPIYKTETQLSAGVSLNPRIAPPLFGLGLAEAIDPEDIMANADPDDRDGDGISGRAHWHKTDGKKKLGRLGWKNTSTSIKEQSARAFLNDMGLSTHLFPKPYGDCTSAQPECINAIHGDEDGTDEIVEDLLDLVTFYASNLSVPARRSINDPDSLKGKEFFYSVGCASCHTPKFATRADAPEALRNQLIWPYSDYLLHDLGEGLADQNPTGDAAAGEWRTQSLWGIGLTKTVNNHTYFLHDGRAKSLEEAILWHGGEGEAARDAFAALNAADRTKLLRFLESL